MFNNLKFATCFIYKYPPSGRHFSAWTWHD